MSCKACLCHLNILFLITRIAAFSQTAAGLEGLAQRCPLAEAPGSRRAAEQGRPRPPRGGFWSLWSCTGASDTARLLRWISRVEVVRGNPFSAGGSGWFQVGGRKSLSIPETMRSSDLNAVEIVRPCHFVCVKEGVWTCSVDPSTCIYAFDKNVFSALVHIPGYALFMWRMKSPKSCYVLKSRSLLEKASNWCFHYVMLHFDKTPNQAIRNKFLSTAICSNVTSVCVIRRRKISVNSEFLVWIHEIMPVKAQTFVTNSPINLEKVALLPFYCF